MRFSGEERGQTIGDDQVRTRHIPDPNNIQKIGLMMNARGDRIRPRAI